MYFVLLENDGEIIDYRKQVCFYLEEGHTCYLYLPSEAILSNVVLSCVVDLK